MMMLIEQYFLLADHDDDDGDEKGIHAMIVVYSSRGCRFDSCSDQRDHPLKYFLDNYSQILMVKNIRPLQIWSLHSSPEQLLSLLFSSLIIIIIIVANQQKNIAQSTSSSSSSATTVPQLWWLTPRPHSYFLDFAIQKVSDKKKSFSTGDSRVVPHLSTRVPNGA